MNIIKKGSTSVTRYIMIVDSTDGTPETGATITTLDFQYTRNRVAPVAKVDATALAATDSAHVDNRAIEIDATNSPGLYRIDWPDAAFATGVDKVILVITGAGFHPAVEEIQLVDYNPEDAVRLGLTCLPNAVVDANNGIVTGDGSVTLTAGIGNRPAVDIEAISGDTVAADNLEESTTAIVTGLAETGTLSTTQMTTDLTEATDEHYNGRIIVWTTGVLANQATDITAYLGSTGRLTYTAVTEAPSNGDAFVIV